MEISMNHSDIPIPFTDAENRELDLREQFRKSADYVVEDDFHGEVYINITDTEDCHSYKNEEYGFALTFPSRAEGNTCKVLQKTYFGKEGAFFVSFAFLLPDDPKKGNGLMSNPVGLYNTPLFVVDPDDERYNT
jgi:hypothetical protein